MHAAAKLGSQSKKQNSKNIYTMQKEGKFGTTSEKVTFKCQAKHNKTK
jgi:hypothetical protein